METDNELKSLREAYKRDVEALKEENRNLKKLLFQVRDELKAAQMDMRPGMSRDESISARQRIEAVIEVLDGDTEGRDG